MALHTVAFPWLGGEDAGRYGGEALLMGHNGAQQYRDGGAQMKYALVRPCGGGYVIIATSDNADDLLREAEDGEIVVELPVIQ
jgi:hypothetical protein